MQIKIHDELPPEASAMLQALYSRSSSSVDTHFAKVHERGPDTFMASYYVGYGHASIGDCGYTTLYIENISLLACKAIQDNPLYSGQETSTRYIDFSSRTYVDPINSALSRLVAEQWMEFYGTAEPILRNHLLASLERPSNQSEHVWYKAISARAFDILRGFLPAGVKSQLAWTTNFRQAHEHCLRLITHPSTEVRAIGEACLDALKKRYPRSFGHKTSVEAIDYLQKVGASEAYSSVVAMEPGFHYLCNIDNDALEAECLDLIAHRPRKQSLPKSIARFGEYRCQFLLDFGSFRDLQRHRGGLCRMPILTNRYGIHPWYLQQLPNGLRAEAELLAKQQAARIEELKNNGASDVELQYLQPIGMLVACELVYDLPQMVYVAELRSGQTSHPTLRSIAHAMATALLREHPRLTLYIDESPDALSLKRGTQDIVELNVSALRLAS